MKLIELEGLLVRARAQNNIYLIARCALMCTAYGTGSRLIPEEKSLIRLRLKAAREKNVTLGLQPGYEIARWLMLSQRLVSEDEIWPRDQDVALIQETCDQYCRERNIKQLASLLHTCKAIVVSVNLALLPPKKREKVKRLAAGLR